jgi:DNA-binding GntR family transcriptional regulator
MPVRDALALLEQDGLVETAARRWTRVVELSPALVEELVPLVSLLDQYAISSAPVVSKEALDRLRIANETFAAAIASGDVTAYIHADTEFHDALVELAANRSLERALRDARTHIRLLRVPRTRRPGRRSPRRGSELAQGDRALSFGAVALTLTGASEPASGIVPGSEVARIPAARLG